jgi:hypothetical protein
MYTAVGLVVVGDEICRVCLIAVLNHKDGWVVNLVYQRVEPFVLLARKQRKHAHVFLPLRPATHEYINNEHLFLTRRQGVSIVIPVRGVSSKVEFITSDGSCAGA